MTFALYALLGDDAPSMTNESLASDLQLLFQNEQGFSLQFETLPFAKSKTLALWWGSWLVRVSYAEGPNVEADSREIQRIAGSVAPCDLSAIDRRIRVVFGDDDAKEYTNQIIELVDFLCEIEGAVVFDPQQNDFIKLRRAE